MKNHSLICVCLAFLAGLFVSCSALSSDSSTSLSITMPYGSNSARTGTAGTATDDVASASWKDDVAEFSVTIQSIQQTNMPNAKNQNFSQTKKAASGKTVTFDEINAGIYKVTVLALSSSGTALGSGEATAKVEQGRANRVTVKVSQSGTATDETETEELTFGGKVSFNGNTYDTLKEALTAANETAPIYIKHTITLLGNVKESLPAITISQNTILNLKGQTLCLEKFEDSENPQFMIESEKTLVITNGTITSESGVEHQTDEIIRSVKSNTTLVLSDLTIKNIKSSGILIVSSNGGSLYMSDVTIKDCEFAQEGSCAINLNSSTFYASNTKIENVLSDTASVGVLNSTGAFVGGSITLTSSKTLSPSESIGDRDSALVVIGDTSNFAVASSTIYSNTAVHGISVVVGQSASLNLSDGFLYSYFDTDNFTVKTVSGYIYADSEPLNLKRGANVIAAAKSSEVSLSNDSTEYAIYIGVKAQESVGNLYIGGNSEIYGLAKLLYGSAIVQTGQITSEKTTKIDFGADFTGYTNDYLSTAMSHKFPLYWGVSRKENEVETYDFEAYKFEVYDNSEYTIKKTNVLVTGTTDENVDSQNYLYAPQMD